MIRLYERRGILWVEYKAARNIAIRPSIGSSVIENNGTLLKDQPGQFGI